MSLSAHRLHPSRPAVPRRSCALKRRYATFHEADRTRRERERQSGYILRVYDCEGCGGWHLTGASLAWFEAFGRKP